MNAGKLASSARLQATLAALRDAGDRGMTTRDLMAATGSVAPHSDAAGLRSNGIDVSCSYDGLSTGGNRVYRYRLHEAVPAC